MEREASDGTLPALPTAKQLVLGLVKSLHDDNAFKSCLRKDKHTLILEGIAGAGKTTTVAMLTNRLKANWQAKLERDPGSLFADNRMVDEQVLSNLTTEVPSVPVTLEVLQLTTWGESVSIVGSIPQLGNWNIRCAQRLSSLYYTQEYPLWFATICIPPGSCFEYKYVVHKGDGSMLWQEGLNSEYVVPHNLNPSASPAHIADFNGRWDAEITNTSKHIDVMRSGSKERHTRPQDGWRIDNIDEEVAVACVSYDSTKPDQHDPMKILMCLLLQLIKQIPEADKVGIDLYERNLQGIKPELEDIGNAIIKIVTRIKSACFIIDALDECEKGRIGAISRTLGEVKRIQAETSIGVVLAQRLTATDDRHGPQSIFKGASHFILKAEAPTVRDYVQLRLEEFSYEYRWEKEDILFRKIADVVVESCEGL